MECRDLQFQPLRPRLGQSHTGRGGLRPVRRCPQRQLGMPFRKPAVRSEQGEEGETQAETETAAA